MGVVEEELEKWAKTNFPIYEYMGLKIVSASNGLYQCSVPLTINTGNHFNTVHAAFQWASAEILGGLIVFSNRPDEKYVPVVRSMEIEFKSPARSGITAEACFTDAEVEVMVASLKSSGRYDFELRVTIRDVAEEIVAESKASYAVRDFTAV